jgi:hypothetical protein
LAPKSLKNVTEILSAVITERPAMLIRTTTAPSKAALPWIKLARFGDLPTGFREYAALT